MKEVFLVFLERERGDDNCYVVGKVWRQEKLMLIVLDEKISGGSS
jgi:hypothetical protein